MSDDKKNHRFMTTEEAAAWNKERGLRPLPDSHWMVKQENDRKRIKALLDSVYEGYSYRLRMGSLWKRLAKDLYAGQSRIIHNLRELVREQESQITELQRMMIYCDQCYAAPGERCQESCSRDGYRDHC